MNRFKIIIKEHLILTFGIIILNQKLGVRVKIKVKVKYISRF